MNGPTRRRGDLKSHLEPAAIAAAAAAAELNQLLADLGEGDLKLVRASSRIRECPWCSLGFVPKSPRATYCRDACRNAANYATKSTGRGQA